MRIYYSHHSWKFGTKIEIYEEQTISQLSPQCEIVNPRLSVPQDLPEKELMEQCFQKIDGCDMLVFTSMDGIIGKGVYDEICHAKKQGKLVKYLYQNQYHAIESVDIKICNPAISKRLFAYVSIQTH